jgi:hypothetical protein
MRTRRGAHQFRPRPAPCRGSDPKRQSRIANAEHRARFKNPILTGSTLQMLTFRSPDGANTSKPVANDHLTQIQRFCRECRTAIRQLLARPARSVIPFDRGEPNAVMIAWSCSREAWAAGVLLNLADAERLDRAHDPTVSIVAMTGVSLSCQTNCSSPRISRMRQS